MNESIIDRDEQILSNELPDVALEIAAAKYGEVGNPFTAQDWTPALREKGCGAGSCGSTPHFHNRTRLPGASKWQSRRP